MLKRDQEVAFEKKDNVMYRIYKHPKMNGGGGGEESIRQAIVPKQLRHQVMQLVHESIMEGHLGVKKPT